MKHPFLLSAFYIFLGLTSLKAHAEERVYTYTYSVRVPALEGTTCESEARSLAVRFESTARRYVISTQCLGTVSFDVVEGGQATLYRLELKYQSVAELPVIPTQLGFGSGSGLGNDLNGVYPSYHTCIEDISNQTRLYQSATGLKPLAAFCKLSRTDSVPHYVLQIDGIGESKRRLYSYTLEFMGQATRSQVTGIQNLIAAAGGIIVKTMDQTTFYYNEKELPLSHLYLGFFQSEGECNQQVAEAQNIFERAKVKSLVQCLASGGATHTYTLEATQLGYEMISNDQGLDSENYLSLQECLSDRSRVLQKASRNDRRPLGVICTESHQRNSTYIAVVYELL